MHYMNNIVEVYRASMMGMEANKSDLSLHFGQ